MQKLMSVLNRTTEVLTVLLILIAAVLTVPGLFGCRAVSVLSGSMEPVLPVGSLIFLDTGDREPEPGDVITFEIGGTTVTHRVLATDGESIRTKGDQNDAPDPFRISKENVVGTWSGICIPVLGFVPMALRSAAAWPALAALLCLRLVCDLYPKERRR